LVEDGEIIGTWLACAMGAASRDRPEATSPRMATTLSRVMSFLAMVADSPGVLRLSS
jgi:hypothetical protein